jgi:DNA polymerase-4
MLPFTGTHRQPSTVDAAVDRVRRRYGKSALTRGVLVGRDPGLEMPHLPD